MTVRDSTSLFGTTPAVRSLSLLLGLHSGPLLHSLFIGGDTGNNVIKRIVNYSDAFDLRRTVPRIY